MTFSIQENIGGLHVAMHAAMFMCVIQGGSDLFEIPLRFLYRERAIFSDLLGQRAPLHIGHDDIGQAILFAIGVNGQDRRVI